MVYSMGARTIFAGVLAAIAIQPTFAAPSENGWRASTEFGIPTSHDRCIALQQFQRNGEALRLGLEARPATDTYELLIEARGSIGRNPWVEGRIKIAGAKLEKDYSVIEPGARAGFIVYQSQLRRGELTASGSDPTIEIFAGPRSISVTPLQLAAALTELDACSGELLAKWGFSKDFQRAVSVYPRPEKELSFYASSSDYPDSALRRGAMGETHALVSVTIAGRASNCRVVRSSGHADIDSASCDILQKRVRFVPARAFDGSAIVAPTYLTMKWEIPRP